MLMSILSNLDLDYTSSASNRQGATTEREARHRQAPVHLSSDPPDEVGLPETTSAIDMSICVMSCERTGTGTGCHWDACSDMPQLPAWLGDA
jgi:hypothetical protein